MPDDATGMVHLWLTYPSGSPIEVGGKEINKGKVTFDYPATQAGNYRVEIQYDGDGKYNKVEFDGSVNVAKLNTTIDVSVDENNVITVSVLNDAAGTITINVDDINVFDTRNSTKFEKPFEWEITLANGLWWKCDKQIHEHDRQPVPQDSAILKGQSA